MKTVLKIVETVLYMSAILIMICALVCQLFQIKPAVVVSGSMEPAVRTGSLVFIDKKDRDAEIGDVISFNTGGALVTHRVIGVSSEGYKTKGDNNDDADFGIVRESQIEGKMLFAIPRLGFLLKTIVLPAGTASILLYIIMKVINRGKRYD